MTKFVQVIDIGKVLLFPSFLLQGDMVHVSDVCSMVCVFLGGSGPPSPRLHTTDLSATDLRNISIQSSLQPLSCML